jgi:hypothetical protein
MSKAEVARFLMQGTFTGKLATVKKDGTLHVVKNPNPNTYCDLCNMLCGISF